MLKERTLTKYSLFLIPIGILINFCGVKLALWLKLPVFLDSVGTILAAALGGYLPGILVGFFSNALNSMDTIERDQPNSLAISCWFISFWWYIFATCTMVSKSYFVLPGIVNSPSLDLPGPQPKRAYFSMLANSFQVPSSASISFS